MATGEVPASARKRYAAGRRVRVPAQIRTARDLLRRHLREEGINQTDLHRAWDIKPESVKSILSGKRPLSPQYIDAAVEFLKLDEFDSLELRLQGALEAGWQIAPAVVAAFETGVLLRPARGER